MKAIGTRIHFSDILVIFKMMNKMMTMITKMMMNTMTITIIKIMMTMRMMMMMMTMTMVIMKIQIF